MTVSVTLNNVTSGYNLTNLNANFTNIQQALTECLGTQGESGNQMDANLDMNNYSLINVKSISLGSGGTIDIDDRFLEPSASVPTVRDDTNPLQDGDIYYNTTSDLLFYRQSGAWVAFPTASSQYFFDNATGTNTLTFTPASALAAYVDGDVYIWRASATNTGAMTMNVSSLGAKTVQKAGGTAMAAGDIVNNSIYFAVYDGDDDVIKITNPDITTVDYSAQTQGQHIFDLLAAGMVARTTNGAAPYSEELATNDVMISGYEFSAGTDEAIQLMVPMPKSWDEGTLYFKFYWTDSATAGTGDVIWGVRAVSLGDSDAADTAFGTAQTVTDAFQTENDINVTAETSAMTVAGTPAAEDLVVFEIYRDANDASDTYTQTAVLIAAMCFYTTDADTDD